MPSMSSIVSVGRPIIKYNFTVVQPLSKAFVQVWRISSSEIFLFITSLSLCVPASAAKVSPLFLTILSFSTSSSEKLSTLKLGSERLILSLAVQSMSEVSISFTQEWSEVESEQRESSSYPVESIRALLCLLIVSTLFSLMGR